MEIINVKVGSPSQSTNVDIENPSQVKAEIKNITINTGGSSKAVLYYPQELTSEQKQQARANIDAASQKDLQDGVNEALKEAKESGDFDGKDGKDATVKIGPVSDLKELPELKIYQVTQKEYNDWYEAGALDPNAVYVTPEGEYAPLKHTHTPSEVGADVSGTAETKVSAHNTSTTAHNDIRLLIQDIITKLTNFLDVDDATVDQLSEVLTLINNNKGTLESLTTSKVNVSAIVDNLTTSDSTKVLSAKQGVAIKSLIDALQTALNSKASASDLTAHTGNTSNPHGVTASQVGAYTKNETNTALNKKANDYSMELYNGTSGNPKPVKFLTIDYSTCTSEAGVAIKVGMVSGHGNGSSYAFLQDAIIKVTYQGVVTVDNFKYYGASVTDDGVARQYGDILWVIDTTNKIVDFYCLMGQYARLQMIPAKRVTYSTGGVITQHTSCTVYSSGEKIWGNNGEIALMSDIPTVPTITKEKWTFTLEDGSTVTKQVHIG